MKASQLVKEVMFYSRLSKLQLPGKDKDETYRPEKLFYYK